MAEVRLGTVEAVVRQGFTQDWVEESIGHRGKIELLGPSPREGITALYLRLRRHHYYVFYLLSEMPGLLVSELDWAAEQLLSHAYMNEGYG